ncbi:RNA-directed DNA polymerase, eukaryota, reverse transcriptase zinc-binding domain protein, partial [Tanacetum coccineum]
GRLTLLKSVLGAIPIYHMSIFKAPMKVLQNMEAIRARFFNRADLNTRKACWVSWKRVLNSKDRGGLGVSSMFAINRALLFIWVWRFITHKNSIWVRVIKALHGSHGRIGSITNNSYPSVWLSILQEVEVLKSKGIELLSFVTPVLGNGKSTSFWDVAWCGDVALKTLAPRIYDLESRKDIVVASKLAHNDLEKSLRRRPRGVSLNNSNDRWSWSLDGTVDFSVSSVRRHIDDRVLPSGNKKTRWIKEVPIKINIHAWKVSIDGLPTRFNLSRRGVEIDSIMCPLCDGHAESSGHLFFSCKNFCDTMHQVSRWWELDFRELHSYDEWLDWMLSIRLSSKLKKVFEARSLHEDSTKIYVLGPEAKLLLSDLQCSWTIIAGTVNLGVAWYLLSNIDGICHPDPKPKRIFDPLGNYGALNWFFLGGIMGPVVVWLCHKAFPTVSWIPLINLSVLLGATAYMPPAAAVNYNSWILVGTIFNFFVFRYRKMWWKRYNYILSVALDAGVAFMAVLLYFTTGLEDISVHWWGTGNPQHCDLATCPTAKGVNVTGCPVF